MAKRKAQTDTIFALASGKGRAGVAVVRASGPAAGRAIEKIVKKSIHARVAEVADFHDPATGELIDTGLVLWFPAPKSFTGEDVAEFHVHGSHAVLERLFGALSSLDGFRLAEPGEFARRAFEHGKLDLTQAEGLNDLVLAETEAQRKQALHQLGGGLSELYKTWRARLADCLADIEATIDFSEEEIPEGLLKGVRASAQELKTEIEKRLADRGRGEAIRAGYRIAILGPANAGKSSLLNALAQEERAIVSDIAGTTRDVIEVQMDLGGYPVVFVDTAGLREAADTIEREGVRRAIKQAEAASLKLVLVEAATWPDIPKETKAMIGKDSLVIVSKADLAKGLKKPGDAFPVSVKTGAGLQALIDEIEARVVGALEATEPAGITRARHREALAECHEALARFLAHDLAATDPALPAEDLRLAARALGRVTGEVGVEDILERIFSRFCIGK